MSTLRDEKKAVKRQKMIDAALAVFSEMGYVGASLDEIANRAQVSKPTLYQYFGNKEQLFSSVLEETAAKILEPLQLTDSNTDSKTVPKDSLVQTLVGFSESYAQIVLAPDVLSMGRLILGVVERFPEIGEDYYNSGPQKALNGMSHYFTQQAKEGKLEITDAELTAHDFWSLILSGPREMYQYLPNKKREATELTRYIFNGLKVFLKAYSSNVNDDLKELEALRLDRHNSVLEGAL